MKRIEDFTAAELSMMPKSARPIGFSPLGEKEMREKYSKLVRHGKTTRDHTKRKDV